VPVVPEGTVTYQRSLSFPPAMLRLAIAICLLGLIRGGDVGGGRERPVGVGVAREGAPDRLDPRDVVGGYRLLLVVVEGIHVGPLVRRVVRGRGAWPISWMATVSTS